MVIYDPITGQGDCRVIPDHRPICFYHGADNDGKLAGAIVKLAYEKAGDDIVMYPWDYGQPFPWDKVEGREVVMVDLALQPFSEHAKLARLANKFVWIDHHKTAINEFDVATASMDGVPPMPGLQRTDFAACELAWFYYNLEPAVSLKEQLDANKLPTGVRWVGRYDIWNHSDPDTLPFKYGLDSHQIDPSKEDCDWDLLRAMITGWVKRADQLSPIGRVLRDGKVIYEYTKINFKKYAESAAFTTVLDGHSVIALNRLYGGSQSIEAVFEQGKHEFMVAFGYTPKSNGQWTVNMYTEEGKIDVGSIAKKFGGGGHAGAAGFQISIEGIQQLCAGELTP